MTTTALPPTRVVDPPEPLKANKPKERKSIILTVVMVACVLYFLFPLYWLVVASTKSNSDLFSTFGLWFADFNLIDNLKNVFTFQDGVFGRWAVNSLIYSVTSAVGASLQIGRAHV